jgi:hypothetical protein
MREKFSGGFHFLWINCAVTIVSLKEASHHSYEQNEENKVL